MKAWKADQPNAGECDWKGCTADTTYFVIDGHVFFGFCDEHLARATGRTAMEWEKERESQD